METDLASAGLIEEMKNSLWIILIVALLFTACSPRKHPSYYPMGTERDEVYKLLGSPDNDDSEIVAIWNTPSWKVVSWRDSYRANSRIAVFENDKTITPFMFANQLDLNFQQMTDKQFLTKVKIFRGLDWESSSGNY